MKYLVYTVFILIVLAVNTEFARLLILTPVRMNLLLLSVVFAAVEKRDNAFLFLAFLSGLFLDFYGSGPFGGFLLSFLIIASVLNWATKTFWVYELNWKLVALFVALAFVASELFVRIFSLLLPWEGSLGNVFNINQLWPRLIYGAAFHLLAALPLYVFWQYTVKVVAKMDSKSVVLK